MIKVLGLSILVCLFIAGCSTTKYEGHEYKYISEQVSWYEAKKLAEEQGGYLVVFETHEEMSFVQSRLARRDTAWVGLTDSENEGEWKWINGEKLDPLLEASFLEKGRDLESRNYGHILLQGGLMSRHKTGVIPRGWNGQEYVTGYVIEWDELQN